MCYLHVQDFVDAYIGPFPSEQAAKDHYSWCKDVRGDGAALMGILDELPDMADPDAAGMVITPEEDKAFVL